MNHRHVIGAAVADDGIWRRNSGRISEISANVNDNGDAQRQRLALRVERELRLRHLMTSVVIGGDRFAAIAGPFHRTIELAGSPNDERLFRVSPRLHSEAAADVRGYHL